MKECIFSIGRVDKRIIWPILLAIAQIFLNLTDNIFIKEYVNIVDTYAVSIGMMLELIIPFIIKDKNNAINIKEICTKQNIKYQSIIWIINFVLFVANALAIFGDLSPATSPHNSLLVTREIIEIICLIIITAIFFKYKYYVHHIVCLIIFSLISVGIDFLLGNYINEVANLNYLQIISNILSIILEVVSLCYYKYMMDKLYYNFWSINFSVGLFLVFMNSLIIICAYTLGEPRENHTIISNYFYMLKLGGFSFNPKRFFSWLILYGLIDLFRLLTLDKLTPNHMLICFEVAKLVNVLTMSKSEYKWYSIILFFLQFVILTFFLEIFEFNFCRLNQNTKRNIEERGSTTMVMRDSVSSENSKIDIEDYYIDQPKGEKIHESLQEMGDMNSLPNNEAIIN